MANANAQTTDTTDTTNPAVTYPIDAPQIIARIAAQWHSGQSSALYSLCSTGKLHSAEHADNAFDECKEALTERGASDIAAVLDWIRCATRPTQTGEHWTYIESMVLGYIECALFCADESIVEPQRGEFDGSRYMSRIPAATRELARKVCAAFYGANRAELAEWTGEQAGRDLWYTRNRHGVGFWDRDNGTPQARERLTAWARTLGESDLYRGRGGWLYFTR